MKNNNIIIKLFEHVEENPDKTAIIINEKTILSGYKEKIVTYRQIYFDTIATAEKLKALGFKKGDRILIFIPMSYSLYVAILAILYIGASAVFIDAWASRKRLTDACTVVKPKGFIGSKKAQILRIVPEIRKIPIKLVDSNTVSLNNTGDLSSISMIYPENVSSDDTALITLTTGTTGIPKGADRTHGLLWNQFAILGDHLNMNKTDIDLTALPVFVLSNLGLGVTSVLPVFNPARPAEFDPALIAEQILKYKITTSIGSPAFYEKLADYLLKNKLALPIKRIFTGGAPVYNRMACKLKEAFPETEIEIVYGCTEAEPVSGILLEKTLKDDLSGGLPVGKKVDDINLKIITPSDSNIVIRENETIDSYLAGDGEVGEIIISGPHVLQRYLGDPANYMGSKIFDKNIIWHRTGDAGRLDSEGNIFLYGRIKYAVLKKGIYYYPAPYELLMQTIPEIKFASVIFHDKKVYAVVETEDAKDNITLISQKMNPLLSDIEPDEYLFINRIPRDPRHNSKIDYEGLKDIISKNKNIKRIKPEFSTAEVK